MINLLETTSVRVKEALRTVDLAIIPVGAVEVNGPHLPQGTDGIMAFHFATELAKRTDAFVAPLVPVGVCPESISFPGTLTVKPSVLKEYVAGIANSLALHGIKRIILIGGHRTNIPVLQELAIDLEEQGVRTAVIFPWEIIATLGEDLAESGPFYKLHGSEMPASVLLAIREDLVNADKFKSVEPKEKLAGGTPGIYTFQPFHKITDDGAIGDSRKASKEKGKEALRRALDNVEAFIAQW